MGTEQNVTGGEYIFTCKDCRSHDLLVVHEYVIVEHYNKTLPCVCGNTIDEIAALRSYYVATACRESGWLDDDHRSTYEESEETEDLGEKEDDYQVFCKECLENAEGEDWAIEHDESEVDEDSNEFYVYCGGCNREIEFGWSHPNRGGRIWPAECTDFNPWKCWPEPRYTDKWAERDWLRPLNRR